MAIEGADLTERQDWFFASGAGSEGRTKPRATRGREGISSLSMMEALLYRAGAQSFHTTIETPTRL